MFLSLRRTWRRASSLRPVTLPYTDEASALAAGMTQDEIDAWKSKHLPVYTNDEAGVRACFPFCNKSHFFFFSKFPC